MTSVTAARSAAFLLALAGVVVEAPPASAQPYDVSWSTVDGGGVMGVTGGPYSLGATLGQPDAGGPEVGGAYVLHSGFWSLIAGDTVTAQADLAVTKTDGLTTVVPGQAIAYTIVVTNAGPSAAANGRVVDSPPPALTSVTWTCSASAGSACPGAGAGAIDHAVTLAVAGTLTYTMSATLSPAATGTLVNTASASPPGGVSDPNASNNAATDTDTVTPPATGAEGELMHGARFRGDLAAVSGTPDRDRLRLRQAPYASYEIVVDETSGDIGLGQGPALDLVAADGATVLRSSQAVGSGPARSLRWMNTASVVVDGEQVRVESASCTTGCGPDDVYRLRAFETTYAIARFNNSASQVTVVVLHNPTSEPVQARIDFWSASGALLLEHPVTLAAKASISLNTSGLPSVAGQGGSMTIMHDAPYGALAGKAVALEPATGFAFDSVLEPRRR